MIMNIFINKTPHELAPGSNLRDAVALIKAAPPFAAAVNMRFVPNTQYAQTLLQPDDRVEIIRPVTGG
jgi:sulfur carrier protein